jgi:eukaryotic-like serine/threonine-protein kinase
MREQSIFIEALEKEDPAEREAFLDRACAADPALRPRIERLFRRHEQTDDVLDAPPAWSAATLDQPIAEGPGTLIGPYKLLEQIGEGGMGAVYVAEQSQPVRRRVALKVIKLGMDTRQVIARFEAERQALAMMDHPNIAKVLDAGTTDAGRPYFVMELVRGIPITEYCDRERLSIPERLELFVLVCRAVQHAHQKGIIHRDLKPSNILVTVIDGAAVPKVIDFGVAKATGASLTEKTIYTGFHQFVGTPLYMSPEQADLSGMDMDTRSDIYSLGVLLYKLLTGTTPFDQDTFRQAAFDEIRRMIRDDEPPRPSTRLSSLGATRSTVSANRKSDARHLDRAVHGELDWIVMKALEKDRRRRYETANDFASDVMRHLTDQPVEACPPSRGYRFAKYATRNRTALMTAAVVSLALVTGTALSVWQAVRAEKLRFHAERRLEMARSAVDDMYTQFARKWLSRQPKLTDVEREFLEKALAFYEQFAAEQSNEPDARFEAAMALYRVGNIQSKLGRLDRAEVAWHLLIEKLEQLVARFPERAEYRFELSDALQTLCEHEMLKLGRLAEAEPLLTRSITISEALVARFPHGQKYRLSLARKLGARSGLCGDQSRWKEAESNARRGRDLLEALLAEAPRDRELLRWLAQLEMDLGLALKGARRFEEAEQAEQRAVERLKSLLVEDPSDPDVRFSLAGTLINLATSEAASGQLADSITDLRRSEGLFQVLMNEFPDVLDYRANLALARANLFNFLRQTGRFEDAIRVGESVVEVSKKLVNDQPSVPAYRKILAEQLAFLADLHSAPPGGHLYNPPRALELARRSVAVGPEAKGIAWQSLGWALYRSGDWTGCIGSLEKTSDYVRNGDFIAAMAYWRLGDQAKAREVFDRSDKWLYSYLKHGNATIYPDPPMICRFRAEAATLLGIESLGTEAKSALDLPRPE